MKQDICMETVHGRKSKSTTTFKAVLNKVLVSALILGTVAGMGTPAFAASISDDVNTADKGSISVQDELSVASAISALRNTITAINEMKSSGSVSGSQLQTLASQLYQLEKSVKSSGGQVTNDVITVISEAENAINGVSNATQAEVALSTVKDSLGIVSVTATNKTASNSDITSFSDVPTTHWAHNQILTMAQKGYIGGTSNPVNGVGVFKPSDTITVDQFVAIAVRSAYPDEVASATGDWSEKARQVAVAHNIISNDSYQGKAFKNPITREEMTMIMIRCMESQGVKTYSNTDGVKSAITDYSKIGGSYKGYVAKAYTMGIMQGKGNGVFDPMGNATRAEAAVILYRCIDPSNRKDADFTTTVTPPVTGSQKWVEGETHYDKPKVGDIVIKDGKKITLKLGYGDVLGAGQGVDIYSGLVLKTGAVVGEGTSWFDGSTLRKDSISGEMHTGSMWADIYNAQYPKNLQGDYDGEVYGTWFKWDANLGLWDWMGPSFA